MANWFECKVSYEKISDNGLPRKSSESYLVDAFSFTDAEARLIEEVTPFSSSGEFTISNIRRVHLAELFLDEVDAHDRYYRCKVQFIMLDEKNGVEKKTAVQMIVKSNTLQNAVAELEKQMGKGLQEYEIVSVTETPIMDVFTFRSSQ